MEHGDPTPVDSRLNGKCVQERLLRCRSCEYCPDLLLTFQEKPQAPADVVRRSDVSFTLPSDNGSPIGYYIITAYDLTVPGTTQWAGSGSPIHQPNLIAGHDYVFTISAVNGIGQGPESAQSNQVTVT